MIFDRYRTCIIPFVCPFKYSSQPSIYLIVTLFLFFSLFFSGTNNNITCKSMWRSVSFQRKCSTKPEIERERETEGEKKTKITTQLIMFFFLFRCEQRLSCLKIVNIATGHTKNGIQNVYELYTCSEQHTQDSEQANHQYSSKMHVISKVLNIILLALLCISLVRT